MRPYVITHFFIMKYLKKLLERVQSLRPVHVEEAEPEESYMRYRLTTGEYEGFLDGQERDAFIKRELERHGFRIGEEILQYKGMNNPYILFEQRG